MVLVQKWPFFQLFFFRQYRPGKCLLRCCRTKKTPFYAIKKRSSKSGKIDIFPKGLTRGFRSKIGHFSKFFLLNIGQENVCYDILERKNAFVSYKKKKLKKSKIWHFFKGVNSWFWSKNGHFFLTFFLGNIAGFQCHAIQNRSK